MKSIRLVNSPTRTANSALDDARNFAASSGRGWLTNFTCGMLLHSRIAIREWAELRGEDAVGRVRAADVLRDAAEERERVADGLLELLDRPAWEWTVTPWRCGKVLCRQARRPGARFPAASYCWGREAAQSRARSDHEMVCRFLRKPVRSVCIRCA